VQLPAVRLYLYDQFLTALCEALDALAGAYTGALKDLEESWGAQQFPFSFRSTVVVELGHVPVWLWRAVLAFAERHDAEAGSSEWHIFDAPSGSLKVYTASQHGLLDRGYHAFITADYIANSVPPTEWTRLYWQPPYQGMGMAMGERHYWPCEFTFRWLRDKLIPMVLHEVWLGGRRVTWPWKRRRDEADFNQWSRYNQIADARLPTLSSTGPSQGVNGLWQVVSELQKYSGAMQDEPVSGEMMADVYKCLVFLAKRASMHYWGYVTSTLGLGGHTQAEIVAEIEHEVGAIGSREDAGSMLDYAMRVAMELVNHGSVQLTSDEVAICLKHLGPVIHIYDASRFLDRHQI
jgi:hypothetical protein